MKNIPFFQHDLGQRELESLKGVLAGPILTTGDTVTEFEERFSHYLGCAHVVAVNSCTGALHLSLLALGIGKGDEVITTPMTFVATATAILEAGATPVFVDVEPNTGNLDCRRIEALLSPRTKAIIPVHLYGQMCDMRSIKKIADKHNLHIIEDSAHCIEGKREGIRPGELGDSACFSFYATKNITCGEGGAIATNDRGLAERLRLLSLHGMTKSAADRHKEGYKPWDVNVLGWKYNLSNIQAALLLPQLERIESSWKERESLAHQYEQALEGIPHLTWPEILPDIRHAYHLFPIWVKEEYREKLLEQFQEQGIGAVVNYPPVHLFTYFQKTYGHRPGDFPIAERIGRSTISLPFYPGMPHEHVSTISGFIKDLLESNRSFNQI